MTIKDLATPEEVQETQAVGQFKLLHHNPNCTFTHPLLKYAFQQKWPNNPSVHYWHVMSEGKSKHSTLSMEGLKEWRII